VRIQGTVRGAFRGENPFGANPTAVEVKADNVEIAEGGQPKGLRLMPIQYPVLLYNRSERKITASSKEAITRAKVKPAKATAGTPR
jgi:hypothetical protein